MEEIVRTLISNKLYLIGAALIVSIIIYAMLKKIIKLMVIILITAAIYIAVIHYSGEKLPGKIEEIKNKELKGAEEILRYKDNIIQIIRSTDSGGDQSGRSSSE